MRLDQNTVWNHYAYLSGDTLLFESGQWIVALDTESREATVVREDAAWPVSAFDVAAGANRVVWTEHASAELEGFQEQDSWSYGDLHQTVVYVRTSW